MKFPMQRPVGSSVGRGSESTELGPGVVPGLVQELFAWRKPRETSAQVRCFAGSCKPFLAR